MKRLLQLTLAGGPPGVKEYSARLLRHEETIVAESPRDAPYIQPHEGRRSRGCQVKHKGVLVLRDGGLKEKDK